MYYTIYMVDYTIDRIRILQRKYINISIYITTIDQWHPCFDTHVYAEYNQTYVKMNFQVILKLVN
jgi:hypothetical protein